MELVPQNADNTASYTKKSSDVSAQDDVKTEVETIEDEDDVHLMKMGYEKRLHRGLGALSNFAFGFTEVAVLASVVSVYGGGLTTGGPAVIFWGFVTTWALNTIVSFNMAEICSAYPSAGSVYHWSAQLVPRKYAPLVSYCCGWSNFIGNAAGDASFAYSFAQLFNATLSASKVKNYRHLQDDYYQYPTYSLQDTAGVAIGVLFVWTALNFFNIEQVGFVNKFAAFCHVGGIFVIVVVILSQSQPLANGYEVFGMYYNATGFDDDKKWGPTYIGAIGLLIGLFSFSGYEASAHMAEETVGASNSASKGVIWTVFATGLGGFFLITSLLFATPDVSGVLAGPTVNPAVNVFIGACGDTCGAGLGWIVVVNLFFAGISSVAVTGRITFALMRDRALVGGEWFSQVNPTTKSPLRALMFVYVWDALLLLLPIDPNGSLAFTAIVSLCVIGFQVSYGIPILMKCIFSQPDFPLRPLNLGKWSFPLGIISSGWLFGTSCLLFLPSTQKALPNDDNRPRINDSNMNWLIVVVAGMFAILAVNWFLNGQYNFKGPQRGLSKEELDAQNAEIAAQAALVEGGGNTSALAKEGEAAPGSSSELDGTPAL